MSRTVNNLRQIISQDIMNKSLRGILRKNFCKLIHLLASILACYIPVIDGRKVGNEVSNTSQNGLSWCILYNTQVDYYSNWRLGSNTFYALITAYDGNGGGYSII